jgi:hypothetical protein
MNGGKSRQLTQQAIRFNKSVLHPSETQSFEFLLIVCRHFIENFAVILGCETDTLVIVGAIIDRTIILHDDTSFSEHMLDYQRAVSFTLLSLKSTTERLCVRFEVHKDELIYRRSSMST